MASTGCSRTDTSRAAKKAAQQIHIGQKQAAVEQTRPGVAQAAVELTRSGAAQTAVEQTHTQGSQIDTPWARSRLLQNTLIQGKYCTGAVETNMPRGRTGYCRTDV